MTWSVPGVLISRDGSVREYLGHSSRKGELFGRAERLGKGWVAVCSECHAKSGGSTRRQCVTTLRDHWRREGHTNG